MRPPRRRLMNDKDSSRVSHRLQVATALMIAVIVGTFGRMPPDGRSSADYHLTTGAPDAAAPMLRSDVALPALRAILVPVAIPTSPTFDVTEDFAVGQPRKVLSRRAAQAASLSLSVTTRAENPNRYSLRL